MKTIRLGAVKEAKEDYLRIGKSKAVWVINHYDRSTKKYSLSPTDDMNREIFRDANCLVEVGFEY
jgi:hypothetical protein